MRYFCLISDYDGTLAHDGQVLPSTLEALKRVKASGRKLVLATGRELPELLRVFPETPLFDLAVVENGAILYNPATGEKRLLAEAPPAAFVEELRRRGVDATVSGRVDCGDVASARDDCAGGDSNAGAGDAGDL